MPARVAVLGGGVGGTLVANLLDRSLGREAKVSVIDPTGMHHYQPGYLYVALGQANGRWLVRDERSLLRPNVDLIVDRAIRILREVQNIKRLSDDLKDEERGTLSIATTHTQARYVLPEVVKAFRERYPEVRLHLHQGTSEQIAEMAALDRIDFAIATGSEGLFDGFVLLPCYKWHRHVVVPRNHPLARAKKITLKQLAAHPIITYVFSFTGPSSLQQLFSKAGLPLNVALTARDADVIKTYVRLGLGVGIVADVAVDARHVSRREPRIRQDRRLGNELGERHGLGGA